MFYNIFREESNRFWTVVKLPCYIEYTDLSSIPFAQYLFAIEKKYISGSIYLSQYMICYYNVITKCEYEKIVMYDS